MLAPAGAVVLAVGELLQQRDLIEFVIVVGVAESIQPAFVRHAHRIHDHIQTVKCPEQSLRLPDIEIDALDGRRLVAGRGCYAIERAGLIGDVESALGVGRHADP